MKNKTIAVASGGGHWKQLMLLTENLNKNDITFITTIDGLPQSNNIKNFYIVKDSNFDEKLAVIFSFFQLLKIFILIRPKIVISTGAAPGVLSILLGRLSGAKTIWVDSIANAEKLSMGGRLSLKIASVVLTQWEHLADGKKVIYKGSVF